MWSKPGSDLYRLSLKDRAGCPRLAVEPLETHHHLQGEIAPSRNLTDLLKAPSSIYRKSWIMTGITKRGTPAIRSNNLSSHWPNSEHLPANRPLNPCVSSQ